MGTKKETENAHILTAGNGITALRIVGTAALVFLEYTSVRFMVIYTLAGITDVLDGWVARLTKTAGKFGATLDSIADLLFYAVMLIKFLPVLRQVLPVSVWYATAAVLLIRLAAYVTAAVKYHRFAALHTVLNKVTGFAVFLLPHAVFLSWEGAYAFVVVALAFVSSTEELIIHLSRKTYRADVKTVFAKN